MDTLSGQVVGQMITYFDNDVRRINHALKVYGFAKAIAAAEKLSGQSLAVLETAAILHDIGIKACEQKYHSTAGSYQELEGPPIARKLLAGSDLPADFIDRVSYLIGNHHSYSKIDGVDFQILVEADFLVNICEDNLADGSIRTIGDKYFKTASGQRYLYGMYHAK